MSRSTSEPTSLSRVMRTIVESGLLITMTSLSMTISYAAESNVVYVTSDAVRAASFMNHFPFTNRVIVSAYPKYWDRVQPYRHPFPAKTSRRIFSSFQSANRSERNTPFSNPAKPKYSEYCSLTRGRHCQPTFARLSQIEYGVYISG